MVIPTFRRPASLRRALDSCQAQVGVAADKLEVVVVDNCPDGSARPTVEAFSAQAQLRVLYEQEPIPGVSAARNRGVASSRGELIAFLDDDEAAEPEWLASLLTAHRSSNADAVFGAVLGRFDGTASARTDLHEQELTRLFPEPAGPVPRWRIAALGTGNSLFRRSCFSGAEPFDLALGLSGGEDSALIRKLVADGRQLCWCPQARVQEYFDEERLTIGFLLKRRFSAGQVRTSLWVKPPHASESKVVMWMMLGAVQATVGIAAAALTSVLRPQLARRYLCLAAGGLGKVLWMSPFRLDRYAKRDKSLEP